MPMCPVGVVKSESYAVSPDDSDSPKLMEMTETPGSLSAYTTALPSRSENDALAASTKTMLACGAMACDHSTSRSVSMAQLESDGG